MGRGLAFSFLLHGMLLAWALVSFAGTAPIRTPEIQPVEVAIISPDDLVRLRKGDRDSKKLETRPEESQVKPKKKIAKKVRKVAVVQPPPPVEPPAPPEVKPPEPAKPEPSKDEIAAKLAALEKKRAAETEARRKAEAARKEAEAKQKAEAEAAAKKKAEAEAAAKKKAEEEAKRKAEAKRKKRLAEKRRRERERKRKLAEKRRKQLAEKRRREREAKKKFDATNIAALLNKIPDSAAPPAGSQWKPDTKKKLPRGPAAGAPEGKDTRLTASQRSLLGVMMKRAVSTCWRVQTGMQGADQLVVDLEVRLKPNGMLDGEPRVVNRRGGALFADAATNAVRALQQCAPYDLPEKLYKGGWDHMVVTFDPQKMF